MPYQSSALIHRVTNNNSYARGPTRRWKAYQRSLSFPLSIFDPCLRAIYLSALDLQARSANIIACNPYSKEAEELP